MCGGDQILVNAVHRVEVESMVLEYHCAVSRSNYQWLTSDGGRRCRRVLARGRKQLTIFSLGRRSSASWVGSEPTRAHADRPGSLSRDVPSFEERLLASLRTSESGRRGAT